MVTNWGNKVKILRKKVREKTSEMKEKRSNLEKKGENKGLNLFFIVWIKVMKSEKKSKTTRGGKFPLPTCYER